MNSRSPLRNNTWVESKAIIRLGLRQVAAVNKVRARAHAENVLPVVEQIKAGDASLRQIAAELNARDIKTVRGGKWHATRAGSGKDSV